MTDKFLTFSDDDLRSIVWAFDVLSLPMSRRREGDDQALRLFVSCQCGLEPNLVNMHLGMLEVFRECVQRGLYIGHYE
jgi:hypothetical protein